MNWTIAVKEVNIKSRSISLSPNNVWLTKKVLPFMTPTSKLRNIAVIPSLIKLIIGKSKVPVKYSSRKITWDNTFIATIPIYIWIPSPPTIWA
jgi:hypothetical protein